MWTNLLYPVYFRCGTRREGPHPAKRTFQAIRIEVNDELNQLKHAVENFCDVTAPSGRILIIIGDSFKAQVELLPKLSDESILSFDPGMLYVEKGFDDLKVILKRTNILLINENELRILCNDKDSSIKELAIGFCCFCQVFPNHQKYKIGRAHV